MKACQERSLRLVWDHVQDLSEAAFQPLNRLAGSNRCFADLAAGLECAPTDVQRLHKDLTRLGLPLEEERSLDFSSTKMAIAAITYRIERLRGH